MRVTIHHTDGVNPYSAEVAALLAERGATVAVVDARNGEHRPPPPVRWLRRLPANFGGDSALRQLAWLAWGLATSLWEGAAGRAATVVANTRFPVEDLAFAALAALGRPVVYVLHNPDPREVESRFRRLARGLLLRRATTVVVHAERLLADIPTDVRPRTRVCPHPPYAHSTAHVARAPLEAERRDGRRWLAYIGTLRWDKGHDVLVDLLALVPADERRELGLVVCGRGSLPDGDWERLAALGIEGRDLTSPSPIPQDRLLSVLSEGPLVLAPYVAATQSGTVILALSMGCRVLAFDQGGIADVLAPEGLVPAGDLTALAGAIADGRGGRGTLPLDAWEQQVGDAWWDVLATAGGGRRA